MRVYVAGATGAIGEPLIDRLLASGHEVIATTRSQNRAAALSDRGVRAVVLDAFDVQAVRRSVLDARPDVLVHQLTALPKNFTPKAMRAAGPLTARLRRETAPVFMAAAREAGARRVVVQSMSFTTRPEGPPVQDETAPLWLDCPDQSLRQQIGAVRDMEKSLLDASGIEAMVLRYGFYYGAGTWYEPNGSIGRSIRRRRLPIIGDGQGLSSFVHIDDAVEATVLSLDRGEPGVYNITDPEPVAWTEWVTETARLLDAKPPLRVPPWLARLVAGTIGVHYATTLRGASSAKARAALGWQPRHWREGFAQVFGEKTDRARP